VADDYQAQLVAAITEAMKAKGFGYKQLARAMGYDYDITVKRWLRRQKAISVASLDRIATALGTTREQLDPCGEAYDPTTRPPHMRRGGRPPGSKTSWPADPVGAELEQARSARARAAMSADYLHAMSLWWHELEPADRERVHDFARQLRDERREARRGVAG
jgi:transcriptional regulator with XRE-family HTH domain